MLRLSLLSWLEVYVGVSQVFRSHANSIHTWSNDTNFPSYLLCRIMQTMEEGALFQVYWVFLVLLVSPINHLILSI